MTTEETHRHVVTWLELREIFDQMLIAWPDQPCVRAVQSAQCLVAGMQRVREPLHEPPAPVAAPASDGLAAAVEQKDAAYRERDLCVAAFAMLAESIGWPVTLDTHMGEWEDDWRNIVYVQTPAGQLSWHYHDSERPLFWHFKLRDTKWDGHATPEKYDRLRRLIHDGIAAYDARQPTKTPATEYGGEYHTTMSALCACGWTGIGPHISRTNCGNPTPPPASVCPRWRPEVERFADLMEAQLRANDHKPGWKSDYREDLFARLREETDELEEILNGPSHETDLNEVGREAADVANFAMMIADVCGALRQDQPSAAREVSPVPCEACRMGRELLVRWHLAYVKHVSGGGMTPEWPAGNTRAFLAGRACGNESGVDPCATETSPSGAGLKGAGTAAPTTSQSTAISRAPDASRTGDLNRSTASEPPAQHQAFVACSECGHALHDGQMCRHFTRVHADQGAVCCCKGPCPFLKPSSEAGADYDDHADCEYCHPNEDEAPEPPPLSASPTPDPAPHPAVLAFRDARETYDEVRHDPVFTNADCFLYAARMAEAGETIAAALVEMTEARRRGEWKEADGATRAYTWYAEWKAEKARADAAEVARDAAVVERRVAVHEMQEARSLLGAVAGQSLRNIALTVTARLDAAERRCAEAVKLLERLQRICSAQTNVMTAYRLGKQPKGYCLDVLTDREEAQNETAAFLSAAAPPIARVEEGPR